MWCDNLNLWGLQTMFQIIYQYKKILVVWGWLRGGWNCEEVLQVHIYHSIYSIKNIFLPSQYLASINKLKYFIAPQTLFLVIASAALTSDCIHIDNVSWDKPWNVFLCKKISLLKFLGYIQKILLYFQEHVTKDLFSFYFI